VKVLRLRRMGDPILRASARTLTPEDICSDDIQELIQNIRYTNAQKQYGVGLAAPQVGSNVRLSVIGIKPTPTRPELEPFDCVIINPSYQGIGYRTPLWEGCQSSGAGDNTLYALVPRYRQIEAVWHDEHGVLHHETLGGFVAHVFQHEADHLDGMLFVDKVHDTKSYMLAREYRKHILKG